MIIKIRQDFSLLVHEHQFCHGNSRVGSFEITKLGFNVSAMHFMIKAMFNHLLFNDISKNIGKSKQIQMVDVLLSNSTLIICFIDGGYKGGFRRRKQMIRYA